MSRLTKPERVRLAADFAEVAANYEGPMNRKEKRRAEALAKASERDITRRQRYVANALATIFEQLSNAGEHDMDVFPHDFVARFHEMTDECRRLQFWARAHIAGEDPPRDSKAQQKIRECIAIVLQNPDAAAK